MFVFEVRGQKSIGEICAGVLPGSSIDWENLRNINTAATHFRSIDEQEFEPQEECRTAFPKSCCSASRITRAAQLVPVEDQSSFSESVKLLLRCCVGSWRSRCQVDHNGTLLRCTLG